MKKDKIIRIIRILSLSIFLLGHISCNKNDDTPKNEPPPPPPPEPEFNLPETEDIVMYEVNLRAFSWSGDLQGVIDGLDHIESLSVNVIWLMPIHPIGEINSVNSPYSVKNYEQVNPEFGTLNDLKTLVKKAHQKDMAVILDWVANHTAWDNPWIENADWYTQDGNGNIISPPGTNWMDVADLNYNNQEMRIHMIEAMEFWIETADVDGFRCDAADMVPFDFWKQAIDSLTGPDKKELILLAEGARNDHFTAGFHLNFSWDFYSRLKEVFEGTSAPPALYTVHQLNYNSVPDGKHKLRFTTNHDESAWDATPIALFNGKDGALAASVITIFLGGVPLIYNGQEVGVEENIPFFSNDPIDWALNPDMLESYRVMLDFYSGSETARKGELATYSHSTVVLFTLEKNQELIFVIVNTKNSNVDVNIPDSLKNTTWTNIITDETINILNELVLDPYQYLILYNN